VFHIHTYVFKEWHLTVANWVSIILARNVNIVFQHSLIYTKAPLTTMSEIKFIFGNSITGTFNLKTHYLTTLQHLLELLSLLTLTNDWREVHTVPTDKQMTMKGKARYLVYNGFVDPIYEISK
jgi:hypothetical protein